MKTIPYDEYEGLINKVSTLHSEMQNLNLIIRELRNENAFLKDTGAGVLVINKTDDITTSEYRSDEKNVTLMLSDQNATLVELVKMYRQHSESVDTDNRRLMSTNFDYEQTILSMSSCIRRLKGRNIINRILNR